ncbi:MAG: hypothetical protein J4G13_11830 [Dehalococcoidia bacterium]|nr:hypothetical protein [Dehalococcoidia bacterium]
MPPDILAIVRDIAIIVMAVMVTVAAATLTVVVLKIFPALRRGARNFETASQLMLETSSRITGLVAMGSELGIFLWDLINRFRNRDNAEPPAEDARPQQN